MKGSTFKRPSWISPSQLSLLQSALPRPLVVNQIEISPVLANKNGLSDVYDTKANNEYFEPTEVAIERRAGISISTLK